MGGSDDLDLLLLKGLKWTLFVNPFCFIEQGWFFFSPTSFFLLCIYINMISIIWICAIYYVMVESTKNLPSTLLNASDSDLLTSTLVSRPFLPCVSRVVSQSLKLELELEVLQPSKRLPLISSLNFFDGQAQASMRMIQ